jgi:6-phosphogluconate dehydrogenase (decarboxylating)
MASMTKELRKRLIDEGHPLVGHSMNQRALKDILQRQRRGCPAKKVLRAMQRRKCCEVQEPQSEIEE